MGNRKQEIQFIPHFIKLEESKYILDERSISTNSKITLPLQKQTNKQSKVMVNRQLWRENLIDFNTLSRSNSSITTVGGLFNSSP